MCISQFQVHCKPLYTEDLWLVVFFGDQAIMYEHYKGFRNVFSVAYIYEHVDDIINNVQVALTIVQRQKIKHFLQLYKPGLQYFSTIYSGGKGLILNYSEMVKILEPGNVITFARPMLPKEPMATTTQSQKRPISFWFIRNFLGRFLGFSGIFHCGIITGVHGSDATILHDPGNKQRKQQTTGVEFTTLNTELGLDVGNEISNTRLKVFICFKCDTRLVYSGRCRWAATLLAHFALKKPRIYNLLTRNCEEFANSCAHSYIPYSGMVGNVYINMMRYTIIPVVSFSLFLSVGYYNKLAFYGLSTALASTVLISACLLYDNLHKNYFHNIAGKIILKNFPIQNVKRMKEIIHAYNQDANSENLNDVVSLYMFLTKYKNLANSKWIWNALSKIQVDQLSHMLKNASTITEGNINDEIQIRCRLIRGYRTHISMMDCSLILTYKAVQQTIIFLYNNIWNETDLKVTTLDEVLRPRWFDNIDILNDVYDLVDSLVKSTLYGYPGKEAIGIRTVEMYPAIVYLKWLLGSRFKRLTSLVENKAEALLKSQEYQYLSLIDLEAEKYLIQNKLVVDFIMLERDNGKSKDDIYVSRRINKGVCS